MPRPVPVSTVAIVEDHLLFAETLEVALTLEGHDVTRLPVSDESMTSPRLLASLLRMRPGIVLLDLDLGPAGDGARLVEPLARAGSAVVVVTASIDETRAGECLRYGARAVLLKSTPLSSILAALRLISEGRAVMSREERQRLIAEYHQDKVNVQALRRRLELLTSREREVLAHLMTGLPVREIAIRSFVSEATVRTQVKSILAKLEVSSQLAAVGAAHKAAWRPPALTPQR